MAGLSSLQDVAAELDSDEEEFEDEDENGVPISKEIQEKATAAKYFIEQSYDNLFKDLRQRAERYGYFQDPLKFV